MFDDTDIKVMCARIVSKKRRCDELMDELDRLRAEAFPGRVPIVDAKTGLLQIVHRPAAEVALERQMEAPILAVIDAVWSDNPVDMTALAMMPSATLLGCRAKASVLAIIPDDALSASLVADILMIVQDVGSGPLASLNQLGKVQS